MKDFLVISLVLCFVFLSIRNTMVFTYFKINQDYITENFCRNKGVKERMCKGTCHLKDMLLEVDRHEDQLPFPSLPTWKIEDHFFPNSDYTHTENFRADSTDLARFYYKIRPSRLRVTRIFHPPPFAS